jgi:hypothetical protein
MKRFSLIAAILFVLDVLPTARAQEPKYDVLTHHNDTYRSGVYSSETVLQPSNVDSKSFGKTFARRVLGQIWGQPLYVRGVPVKGRLRNVVYVATSQNMVYGFDADDRTADENTKPLMSVFLGAPGSIGQLSFYTIFPSNGITSTPAIDLGNPPNPSKGMLYVVAKLKQDDKFHIFTLNLPSLAIQPNASGQLTGVIVSGTAPGQGTTTVSFDKSDHLNRPALLISNNHLILAFGSGPKNDWDAPNYHGWVLSYSLPNLVQTGVFITTPTNDTGMGGIWQSGNGPAADDQGNVYFLSGNGRFQSTAGRPDLANAFVKLANSDGSLQLVDWYTPPSREVLAACDLDLGSSGPTVLQAAGKLLGVGKSGILYVLDKENLGKTDTALAMPGTWRGTPDCTTGQCFRVAENQYQPPAKTQLPCSLNGSNDSATGFNNSNWNNVLDSYPHVHGAPVVWNLGNGNLNLYVWPEQDFLKAYRFDGQKFSSNPVGSSAPVTAAEMSMPGGVLSLSWNGSNTKTGILWTARPDGDARQYAVGTPFVSAFNDQQHFVFQNNDGVIWDSYYEQADNGWHFQQINYTGIPASGGAFVSVFDSADQQHFAYTDSVGNLWDSFYRGNDDSWHLQQINTGGHTPVDGIFVSAFHDQQHFVWRDGSGSIWDSFYAQGGNSWHFQQINTSGHPAAGSVFVSVFDSADQQHFAYTDSVGNIWDSFYRRNDNSWHFQQISTGGHTPVGGIFVSAFHDQQHFVWRDGSGNIWDSFYAQGGNSWHFQQINTSGHPAAGSVFVSVFDSADQQHFAYADSVGNIWDSFYRGNDNSWHFQQINTNGHPAAGDVFVSVFDSADQQHFAYRDSAGNIWDSFYRRSDNTWLFQGINNTFHCMDSMGADLTPNNAPCNAINKIVHGYMEAFDATPRTNGQLVELWNSKDNGSGGGWFAKQSPPTIADGKVFLAEFPPPIPGQKWSDNTAFGRLVVYSLH